MLEAQFIMNYGAAEELEELTGKLLVKFDCKNIFSSQYVEDIEIINGIVENTQVKWKP